MVSYKIKPVINYELNNFIKITGIINNIVKPKLN